MNKSKENNFVQGYACCKGSLRSLIESKGMDVKRTVVILKSGLPKGKSAPL